MLWKYLKDQGGQFWGAFGPALAESLNRERERPLKEAMLKAQIGHQEALNQKAQFDMQQAQQQQAAVEELGRILQPKKVSVPGPTVLPDEAAGEPGGQMPPVETMQAPALTDPAVRAQLLKSGVRGEVLSQMAKAAFPSAAGALPGGGATFNSFEDLIAFTKSPAYAQAFPAGARTVVGAKGQIMLQGIDPVNAAEREFHAHLVQNPGDVAGATAKRNAVLYQGSASSGAGRYAGATAQEIGQPIQPQVPFAQPGAQPSPGGWQGNTYFPPGYQAPQPQATQPNVSTPTAPSTQKPGETPEQTKQRLRKEAQVQATPPTQAQIDTINAYTTNIAAIDQLLNNFPEKEIESLSGWSRFGESLNQMGVEADKVLGTSGMLGDKAKSQRFSQYKNLVGLLKNTAFALGGKQLTPFEASVVFQFTPTDNDYSTDLIQKAKSLRDFNRASLKIRERLQREGKGNIDLTQLDAIMRQELGSRFAPQGQQQGGLPPPPAGWK